MCFPISNLFQTACQYFKIFTKYPISVNCAQDFIFVIRIFDLCEFFFLFLKHFPCVFVTILRWCQTSFKQHVMIKSFCVSFFKFSVTQFFNVVSKHSSIVVREKSHTCVKILDMSCFRFFLLSLTPLLGFLI